jgi:hypothetical protein
MGINPSVANLYFRKRYILHLLQSYGLFQNGLESNSISFKLPTQTKINNEQNKFEIIVYTKKESYLLLGN